MLSSSMEEASIIIKQMLQKRFVQHGFPIPKIFFSDQCCDDRPFLQKVYRELGFVGDVHHIGFNSNVPIDLPPAMVPRRVIIPYDRNAVALVAIDRIRSEMQLQRLQVGNKLVLGIDMQWNSTRQGLTEKVATIQISLLNGLCFLFRLKLRDYDMRIPDSLTALLADATITKAGVGINTDLTMLKKSKPEIEMPSILNVAQYALQVVPKLKENELLQANSSILRLVQVLMPGRTVHNNSLSLTTDWESPILGDVGEIHACTQAYIAIQLYKSIIDVTPVKCQDVPGEEDLPSGSFTSDA
jgi:hypothetical protein